MLQSNDGAELRDTTASYLLCVTNTKRHLFFCETAVNVNTANVTPDFLDTSRDLTGCLASLGDTQCYATRYT